MAEKQPQSPPQGKPAAALKPCPVCKKLSSPASHPFCSKRCADVDLHRWLGGTYAIPVVAPDDNDEEDEGHSF